MIGESFVDRTQRARAFYQAHMPYHARNFDEKLERLVEAYQRSGAEFGTSDDVHEMQNIALHWLESFSVKVA